MRILVLLLLPLLVTACARVTVETTTTPNGTDWSVTYNTFFRKVEEVNGGVGAATFSLGSAGSDAPISNEILACALSPHLCQ